ncbi:MAG TPA: ABC transporter ATP-binding protein [Chloroflexota bacterium]|jgi:putative ABC transport system ATP-binding protein
MATATNARPTPDAAPVERGAAVTLVDVVRTYRVGAEEVHALGGVSMTIQPGEFMSVMGRSGSGKSTLLNVMGCLDRPTAGRVLLDDLDVTALPEVMLPRVRRERVGFVFQQFNLLPVLTAIENVELPMKYAGVPADERRERALRALAEVGLADRVEHRPGELSGGQQQRVAVARALAPRPSIVLADEPTGALDSATAGATIGLMRRLNRELGQTFVIVTHDPLVTEQTDRVVRLQDGRVASDEPVGRPAREVTA